MTALVSTWSKSAQAVERSLYVAWLSLDERDNDPVLFWSYVCASLQGQVGSLGQGAQALLRSVQGTNLEAALTALLNDLARLPPPILLVLDDFHLIRSPAIASSLAFLLDRMPPQLHLVILTRSDPHLPLALLRSRGQLLEVRQDDLRFSAHEAGSFLNTGMGLGLAPQAVEALQARTEGWVAGLQMAAASLRGHEKADEFIASFSGSNRYILDYLFEEVLKRQLPESQADDPGDDIDYAAEAQRWFDYWLKGVDNGIMQEPPIHYYLQGMDRQAAWQVTDVWPPKNEAMTRFYFGAGAAPHEGALVPAPAAGEAFDVYTVDYTTTSGPKARWTAVNWAHEYPDMRANDAKALAYTTPPLQTAAQVVGHPVVHLWLSSDAPDLDVFAYLEEVDGGGDSTYITEGTLRASHRGLAPAPYDNLGLPYRNHFQSEVTPIPAGEPVELVFDLLPTAYQFSRGKQIRITVAFADADNFDTPILSPAPMLRLLRSAGHPSYVEIPLVEAARSPGCR